MIKTPNTTSQAKKSEQQTQQNQQVELVNPSFNVEDTTTTLNLNETAEQTAIIQEMSTKGFSSIRNRMKQRVLKVLETPDQLFSPKAYAAMIGEEDSSSNAIWSRKQGSKCADRWPFPLLCIIKAPHEKQKTGRGSCSYLLPRFFLSLVACSWVALLVTQMVKLIDQGSALLQDFIELFSWVAFCTCHIYSWYTVIQAAQDGTIGRRYCLAEELMHDKIEKKDLKVRREWILFGLLWVVVSIFISISGYGKIHISSTIDIAPFINSYILLPSFVLNGVMDARTYDLLSNTKMVHMLTEKLFDQVDETGKTKIDDLEFSKLLNTVRKLVAAIQMFSVSSTPCFQFVCYVYSSLLIFSFFSFLF